MIAWIPYVRWHVQTRAPLDVLVHSLRSRVHADDDRPFLSWPDPNALTGDVERNGFELYLASGRAPFTPVARGRFHETGQGTVVETTVTMPPMHLLILVAVAVGMTVTVQAGMGEYLAAQVPALADASLARHLVSLPLSIGVVYAAGMVFFNWQLYHTVDALKTALRV